MSKNTYTQKRLNAILRDHKKWVNSYRGDEGARAILTGANLSGMDLSGADLRGVNMIKVDLSEAYLTRARLSRANLSGANLSSCNAREADFRGANLHGANLQEADLTLAFLEKAHLYKADCRRAYLSRANLAQADLHGIRLDGADLTSVNLEKVKGLVWADCAFAGHGEAGRRLLAIRTKPRGKLMYYCGCFRGDENELRAYIRTGVGILAKSRLFALEFLKQAVTFKPRTLED